MYHPAGILKKTFDKTVTCLTNTLSILMCLLFFLYPCLADDWPTYQHDTKRSGISAEELKLPLTELWVFSPTYPPSHAWSDPQPKPVEGLLELPRLRFDDAFHVGLFFLEGGSSPLKQGEQFCAADDVRIVYDAGSQFGAEFWITVISQTLRHPYHGGGVYVVFPRQLAGGGQGGFEQIALDEHGYLGPPPRRFCAF